MASVQFYNAADVIRAYQDRDCKAWSIWQHKQFMFKGIGDDEFTNVINLLAGGATNAVYTVKVYEDIEDPKKIKSNTPDDGSFNFRLNDDKMTVNGYQQTRLSNEMSLHKRIDELEKLLTQEADEVEEEKTIGKAVGDVLIDAMENPDKLAQWVGIFKDIFSGNKNTSPAAPVRSLPYQTPGNSAVGSFGNTNDQDPPKLNEEQMHRVATALDTLEKIDPKIDIHLEKLATITKTNPKKFNSLITMLDLM